MSPSRPIYATVPPKQVAPNLINFVAGVGAILVKPAPYFIVPPEIDKTTVTKARSVQGKYSLWDWMAAAFISLLIVDELYMLLGVAGLADWNLSSIGANTTAFFHTVFGRLSENIPSPVWYGFDFATLAGLSWLYWVGYKRTRNKVYLPASIIVLAAMLLSTRVLKIVSIDTRRIVLDDGLFGLLSFL